MVRKILLAIFSLFWASGLLAATSPRCLVGEWNWTCTECWNILTKQTPDKAGYSISLIMAIDSSDTTAIKVSYAFYKNDTILLCDGTANVTYPLLPSDSTIFLTNFKHPYSPGLNLGCDSTTTIGYVPGCAGDLLSFHLGIVDAPHHDYVRISTLIRPPFLKHSSAFDPVIFQYNQKLAIKLPASWKMKADIKIVALSGKCLFSQSGNTEVAIPNLGPGCYFVKISNAEQAISVPLLVH
jgi:hypothetical protein